MISKSDKIFVAGHKGLVGSAIIKKLKTNGYTNLLTINRNKLDLTNQKKVFNFLKKEKPKFIFIAAAKVGGIYLNARYKADFLYQNIAIQTNLIHGAFLANIKDLIFLGSSCAYPRNSKQPIKEKYLLNGYVEETNDAYAIAKIAGVKMCEAYNLQYKINFKSLMSANVFGPNDNYDDLGAHFIPAMIKKIHKIKIYNLKKLILWGHGKTKRELIYVDDIADACIYFMNKKINEHYINIGTGKDYTIKEYAKKILKIIIPNEKIKIIHDLNKPNGMPRKLLDVTLAKKYGWRAKTKFELAIKLTYDDFLLKKGLQ